MSEYYVPAGAGESEYIEKRSRFIGHVRPVESEEDARAFIAAVKKEHYDARHNCWCYLLHDGPERYSDDGEPQGTAGIPMLEVFRREGVSNLVCVVTRYFGGVLLGTGGLSRAYSDCAKEALLKAGLTRQGEWTAVSFSCAYPLFDRIRTELAALGAVTEDLAYGQDIRIRALLPAESLGNLQTRLQEISAGKITVTVSGPVLRGA